jgi:hypothetical protein
LAALDKARAMMDAYEVTEEELSLTKDEAAILHATDGRDHHTVLGNDTHGGERGSPVSRGISEYLDESGRSNRERVPYIRR